jgi:hypothetical protein
MPRRELLSPAQREALLALPTDEGELIRHYTLGAEDLHLIRVVRTTSSDSPYSSAIWVSRVDHSALMKHLRRNYSNTLRLS